MNEITPDLIARIASRLYNDIPGASGVPHTPHDLPQIPESPASLPSLPGVFADNRPTSPSMAAVPNVPSLPGLPSLPTASPSIPGVTDVVATQPTVASGASTDDGLRNFVQRIRVTHLHDQRGLCAMTRAWRPFNVRSAAVLCPRNRRVPLTST